ncbi:MAG: hypothetical protein ACT6S0_02980 [Roseateles sp.]|uniref:hypothetical protein n=1 Tax=Roseateles sp. TaxID=1971397 RepID=UPI004036902E
MRYRACANLAPVDEVACRSGSYMATGCFELGVTEVGCMAPVDVVCRLLARLDSGLKMNSDGGMPSQQLNAHPGTSW